MTQYFLEDWITEHFSFVRPIVKLLCALLQACLSVHSTSVSEEKDRDKVAVCETPTSWRGVLSNEEVVTKEEKEDIQLHVDPMCLLSPSEQAYGREKTQNHTLSSPPSLCYHQPSLCVCGCVSERNNAIPQSPGTIVMEGVKRGAWKEEGWMVFRPVWLFPPAPTMCGKTLWVTETRHSFTQTLLYTSRTDAMQTGKEGGVKETEQKNFSDLEGIHMERGHCEGDVPLI